MEYGDRMTYKGGLVYAWPLSREFVKRVRLGKCLEYGTWLVPTW